MKSLFILIAFLACAQAQFVYPSTSGTFRYATDTPTILFRVVSGTAPATVVVCHESNPLSSGATCNVEISCSSVTPVAGSNTDYTCAISTGLTVSRLIYVINSAGQGVSAKQGDVVSTPSLVAGNALTKRAATIASVVSVSGISLTTLASDYTSVTVTTAAGSGTYQCPVGRIITTTTSLGCSIPAGTFTDAQTGVVNIAASLFGKGMSATQSDTTSYITPSVVPGTGLIQATTASAAEAIIGGQSLSATDLDYSNVTITTTGGGVYQCPTSGLVAVTTSTIGCRIPAYNFNDCEIGAVNISFTLYGVNIPSTLTDHTMIPVGVCTPAPSAPPAVAPSASPKAAPSAPPASVPSASPASAPSASPTSAPSDPPASAPSASPTGSSGSPQSSGSVPASGNSSPTTSSPTPGSASAPIAPTPSVSSTPRASSPRVANSASAWSLSYVATVLLVTLCVVLSH